MTMKWIVDIACMAQQELAVEAGTRAEAIYEALKLFYALRLSEVWTGGENIECHEEGSTCA